MATQTVGRALLVQQNLPGVVAITTTTGAAVSPIVVTAPGHNVKVNELLRVSGVVGNTAANRDWYAAAVTTNTITLKRYPEGTNGTGNGAYVSGGFVQSLGFGVTVPVPNDLTDAETAGSINVPHEAELDRLAWLLYQAWVAQDKYAITPSITTKVASSALVASGGAAVETITATAGIGTASAIFTVNFPSAKTGDVLKVDFAIDAAAANTIDIDAKIYATIGASATQVPGCCAVYKPTATARGRLVMTGAWVVTANGSLDVALYVSAGVGDTWSNYGSGALVAELRHLGI